MTWEIREGDALERLRGMPDGSVQCCVTSPPYFGLRDYGINGQFGLEATPDEYVVRLVGVFRGVRRVLRDDGVLWLNLGDSYAGSWGAQSRPNGTDSGSTLQGGSMLSARQIAAHPKLALTGSLKNTPGCKPKDLIGIPWMLAFALRADGWYLRSDIIWAKPNPMPESVTDRPTSAHEHLFLLAKSRCYFYNADAIREDQASATLTDPRTGTPRKRSFDLAAERYGNGTGASRRMAANALATDDGRRNKRNVWEIATQPFAEAHFATFPPKLVEPCVLAGSRPGDLVLDPFAGAGTVGLVALRHDRSFIGIELNPQYAEMARERIRRDAPLLNTPAEVAA